MKLERSPIPLVSPIEDDGGITAEAIAPFDLTMEEVTKFFPFVVPEIPEDYHIGVIVGASGTGKSLLLNGIGGKRSVGDGFHPYRPIAAHFGSAKKAQELLYAVGLNSVPKWKLPYYSLSTGERHRVDVAKALHDDGMIDEFTSVIDRDVAVSLSVAVSRYVRKAGIKRLVIATCHRDVVSYLKPDWIIDTDAETFENDSTYVPVWWKEWLKHEGPVGRIELRNTRG